MTWGMNDHVCDNMRNKRWTGSYRIRIGRYGTQRICWYLPSYLSRLLVIFLIKPSVWNVCYTKPGFMEWKKPLWVELYCLFLTYFFDDGLGNGRYPEMRLFFGSRWFVVGQIPVSMDCADGLESRNIPVRSWMYGTYVVIGKACLYVVIMDLLLTHPLTLIREKINEGKAWLLCLFIHEELKQEKNRKNGKNKMK